MLLGVVNRLSLFPNEKMKDHAWFLAPSFKGAFFCSLYRSIRMGSTHDEINRIELELDQNSGRLKKAQPSGKAAKHQSFDAVVATSALLVVVAKFLNFLCDNYRFQ